MFCYSLHFLHRFSYLPFFLSSPTTASNLSSLPSLLLCPLSLLHPDLLGRSHKKSASSSDDSDCDISPWLSSAPSHSGTSPSHSHTHEASAHTTLVVGKRSIQLHDSDNEGMF